MESCTVCCVVHLYIYVRAAWIYKLVLNTLCVKLRCTLKYYQNSVHYSNQSLSYKNHVTFPINQQSKTIKAQSLPNSRLKWSQYKNAHLFAVLPMCGYLVLWVCLSFLSFFLPFPSQNRTKTKIKERKGTKYYTAELIDNSIDAQATRLDIDVTFDHAKKPTLIFTDNGYSFLSFYFYFSPFVNFLFLFRFLFYCPCPC